MLMNKLSGIFRKPKQKEVIAFTSWANEHAIIFDSLDGVNTDIDKLSCLDPFFEGKRVIYKAGVGFSISPEYWNRGYCTEALISVIKYGLIDLDINRLEATCKIDNIASQRVMEKAGMKYEGTLRQYSYKDGYYHVVKMFSVIRSDIKDEK